LRVFLSYARVDSAFARRLAADLKAAGVSVWLDRLEIRPGSQWDREVEKGVRACEQMLVILSPASVESDSVMDEVGLALEEGKTVIPVVQDECKIPFRLRRLQHIDFRSGYEPALRDLLEVLVAEETGTPVQAWDRGVEPSTEEEESDPEDEPQENLFGEPATTGTRESSSSRVSLFPLYGITLGLTTKSEIAKLGTKATSIDKETGKPHLYYTYKGIDFWYDEESKLVESIHLFPSEPAPEPWQVLGFRWENSYNQWLSWLRELGYSIEVIIEPHIERHEGEDDDDDDHGYESLCAEVLAQKAAPYPHSMDLDFNYSEDRTTTDAGGTLFSIYISADS
jgi:hypothetical protein